MMLYRPDYYAGEKDDKKQEEPAEAAPTANQVEVIVAKNRHGQTTTIPLVWDAEHTLFVGIDRIRNEM